MAAHHAVQRDVHLDLARRQGRSLFTEEWTKYRDGQRAMLHSIVTHLHQQGNHKIADEIVEKFGWTKIKG